MRFHEKLKAAVLAAHIERYWRRILRLRKQGDKLIAGGEALNSERLLRLNRQLDRCGLLAATQEKYYETHYVQPIRVCTYNTSCALRKQVKAGAHIAK